ncbi:MAG TPA: chemotaxis protein CheB [Gemmatimonadaceae bacterium]|nr:chemotaxis protein CheB [Gemmatimonadaceae bacterium]
MPGHDLIVLGASAGGVEAVSAVVAGLPADLRAAVCVVVHLRPDTQSHLAEILARLTPLRVTPARHGMAMQPGTIHVAVPDLHMLVERDDGHGVLRLVRGPRENRARPAVDPLFRSAALAYGPRVIGVILSGALDDGTAGLWTVKDRGGMALVQDPEDAAVPSMPTSALTEVVADHVATARELGPMLGRLALEPVARADAMVAPSEPTAELENEIGIGAMDEEHHQNSARYGQPSRYSCPDCGGVLWDLSAEGPLRFRCEVGHAHSAATLAEMQTEVVEAAMWTALRALEDKVELARRRGAGAAARGLPAFAAKFAVEEQAAQQHATALRALLRLDGRTGIRPRLSGGGDSTDERPDIAHADAADAKAGVDTLATGTLGMD